MNTLGQFQHLSLGIIILLQWLFDKFFVIIFPRLPVNGGKNRYSDVLCYDFTRVHLESSPSDGIPADYINANHVNGYNQKRGYICCQGPLPKTFNDFWRMVWQEKVRTIVMTTKWVFIFYNLVINVVLSPFLVSCMLKPPTNHPSLYL